MKILVLSLMRMGDFFQQIPLLNQLVNEGNEVHVLVNDSLKETLAFFPLLKAHFFSRNQMQKILASRECNTLSAIAELRKTVTELNAENFDCIENWTHNFLSARLMDLLQADVKKGARFVDGVLLKEKNRALTYLNESWGEARFTGFHWIDTLAFAMGHATPKTEKADDHRVGPIYLQVLTSDVKKNWALRNWKELAAYLEIEGHEVKILCAPFEQGQLLTEGFNSLQIAALNLVDLKKALSKASLLVTGDTSVAHLAALHRTPTLALFLGSANPWKTAPRLKGARVLWSQVICSPCRHRSPCSQAEFICSKKLSIETVKREVTQMIQHDPQRIEKSDVRRFEVKEGIGGALILDEAAQQTLGVWVQMVWQFYFNRDHENVVAPYGSAARLVLQKWNLKKEQTAWVESLKSRINQGLEIVDSISEALWLSMRDFNVSNELKRETENQMRDLVTRLHDLWQETDFVIRLKESMISSDENPFVRIRQRKESLQEVYELFAVQKNLIRVIDQELKERGVEYGARA